MSEYKLLKDFLHLRAGDIFIPVPGHQLHSEVGQFYKPYIRHGCRILIHDDYMGDKEWFERIDKRSDK